MRICISLSIAVFMILMSIGQGQDASITVGGWKFMTDLDGWRSDDECVINAWDSSTAYGQGSTYWSWKGVMAYSHGSGIGSGVLYYPAYPKAPKGNMFYNSSLAVVEDIFVLKIPKELKSRNQEREIAVYGSLDKVPDDQKQMDLQEIVDEAVADIDRKFGYAEYDSTPVSTRLGDRIASRCYNREIDNFMMMSVLLDNDTVSVISVRDLREFKPDDQVVFNGTLNDIINSLTITKA